MSDLANLIREASDGASNRKIAASVGVSPETVNRIMRGEGDPDVETVDKIARALRIPIDKAREAAAFPRGGNTPYIPPAEANLLDARQRKAVDEIIRVIVATRRGADHGVEAATQSNAPHEAAEGEKTFIIVSARSAPDGQLEVHETSVLAESESRVVADLVAAFNLAGLVTEPDATIGGKRVDLAVSSPAGSLFVEVTRDDPRRIELADQRLRELVSNVQPHTADKASPLNRANPGRRLDIVRTEPDDDAVSRDSYNDDASGTSTSNISEEIEDRPAARRGKGKTKGELLRDEHAKLGEEPDSEGPEEGA